MPPFLSRYWKSRSQPGYDALETPEGENDLETEKLEEGVIPRHQTKFWYRRRHISLAYFAFISTLCVILGLGLGYLAGEFGHQHDAKGQSETKGQIKASRPHKTCPDSELTVRREWSTLDRIEKREYIQAVKCLMTLPAKTKPTGTLFEDFSFIRAQIGMHTTGVASFLPWHRYFLYVFEKELKESCGYKGNLTYWDWTRDWKSLAKSSVFNSNPGFGGNGDKNSPPSTGGGYCVADGNFASRHLEFDFDPGFGIQPNDHCLSRGFNEDDLEGRLVGAKVKPDEISKVLAQPDYESFSQMLQAGPGAAIQEWINGDFGQYTAPNDPLYYLHLVQLDRLWWMWQHGDPLTRFDEYAGLRRHDFDFRATLDDVISVGTLLAPDVKVADAMWGQLGIMCYTYYQD